MEQSTLPNQEIVVQFNVGSITPDEAQRTISEITSQLKTIGVEDVQIYKILDGKLKVTYYSTIDISVIKNLFYKQNKLPLNDTAFNEKDDSSKIPFSTDTNTYKLEVVKIQKDLGSDIGLRGLPLSLKSAKDQYLNLIVSLGTGDSFFGLKRNIESVGYKNYRKLLFLINTTSHKIPEVRAGPLS